MDLQHWAAEQLRSSGAAIAALLADVAQPAWKTTAGQWSALEVIAHLLDEERLDFRQRLMMTLDTPHVPLPSIDPPAWLVDHRYAERDAHQVLAEWRSEREASLHWLSGLVQPDWQRRLNHPYLHQLTAGDLLASWVAHDLLHLRQLIELRYAQIAGFSGFQPEYAGDW